MHSHRKWRLRARAGLEAYFHDRSFPRFGLGLIVTIAGLAGFLISHFLLHHGFEEMWLRYPLVVTVGYLVFLGQLRLWAELAVYPVERIPTHIAVVSRRVGGGPERIQDRHVGLRDEAENVRAVGLRDRRAGQGGASDSEQGTAIDHRARLIPGGTGGQLARVQKNLTSD